MFDILVKLETIQILHLSHLSIDIILEATATTIVQFEQNDILQFDSFDNNDYYLKLIFSSLQNDTSFDSLCDTDITMMSSRELYEDALILFDYYQGYSYLNKVLEFAIKEMINKRIIKPPIKMTYRGGYTLSYYPIHSVYPYKVKDIR